MTRLLPLVLLLACSKSAPSDDTHDSDVGGDDTDTTSDSGDTDVPVLPCDVATSGTWAVTWIDAHGSYDHEWTLDVACDGDHLAKVTQDEAGQGQPIELTPVDGGVAGAFDFDWDDGPFVATVTQEEALTFPTPETFTGTWTNVYTFVSGDLGAFQATTYADGEVATEPYDLTGTLSR